MKLQDSKEIRTLISFFVQYPARILLSSISYGKETPRIPDHQIPPPFSVRNMPDLLYSPIFEADILIGQDHTCNGKPLQYMSSVRTHLEGNCKNIFLKRYETVEEDILIREDHEAHHEAHCDNPRQQARGSKKWEQWDNLYPNANPPGTPLPARREFMLASCLHMSPD